MSITIGWDWGVGFMLGVALGLLIGGWIEAWVWRASAKDYVWHKSGRKKYIVREYHL